MAKMSTTIKQNLTRVILIVFSVVLGLYLSERIEERKQQREARELLAILKAEIQENIVILNEWVPYHQIISRRLDSLAQEPEFIEAFIESKEVFYDELLTKGNIMGASPPAMPGRLPKDIR